ncbi:MAG: pyridoxal-dependent decarboxylase [Actinomycetota bacterium]
MGTTGSASFPPPRWQWTHEEISELGQAAAELIAGHLAGMPQRPVFQPFPAGKAAQLRAEPVPSRGTDPAAILAEIATTVLAYPFGNGHPRFWGWVNSPPHPVGVAASALAAALNPSVAGGNHAAVHLEHQVVRWFTELAGFGAAASGLLTSGASAATITALAIARQVAAQAAGVDLRADGLAGSGLRLVLYTGTESHSCAQKAAELLGVGSRNVTVIGSDAHWRMDPAGLDVRLRADRSAGRTPMAVVATVGSVSTGAIDPIGAIADVCAEHGVWLHLDGAYGAPPVLLLDQFAGLRRAVARADSLALDPHKWLYVPVDAGLLLLADGQLARDTFSLVPPYLRTDGDENGIAGPPWFSEFGLEQTRPFRALKVWASLKYFGLDGYRALIGNDLDLAAGLARQVGAADDLELLAAGLSICCFRVRRPGLTGPQTDELNRAVLAELQLGGEVFVTGTTVGDAFGLRACFINPGTGQDDITAAVSLISATGTRLARQLHFSQDSSK